MAAEQKTSGRSRDWLERGAFWCFSMALLIIANRKRELGDVLSAQLIAWGAGIIFGIDTGLQIATWKSRRG